MEDLNPKMTSQEEEAELSPTSPVEESEAPGEPEPEPEPGLNGVPVRCESFLRPYKPDPILIEEPDGQGTTCVRFLLLMALRAQRGCNRRIGRNRIHGLNLSKRNRTQALSTSLPFVDLLCLLLPTIFPSGYVAICTGFSTNRSH